MPTSKLQKLSDLLQELDGLADQGTLEDQIEVGSALWEAGDRIKNTLDKIKGRARAEALTHVSEEKGSYTIDGSESATCTVTIPSPSTSVVKGTDMESLKTALGTDFTLYFEEVTTYKPRPEFGERVVKVDNQVHQDLLVRSVFQKENTPRVSFRRPTPKKKNPEVIVKNTKSQASPVSDVDSVLNELLDS